MSFLCGEQIYLKVGGRSKLGLYDFLMNKEKLFPRLGRLVLHSFLALTDNVSLSN